MDFAGVFVLEWSGAGVHEGYKAAAAGLDFDRKKGKMAAQRLKVSILLAAAAAQGMDRAAAEGVEVLAAEGVWTMQKKEKDRLKETSAGVE
jgi:hypothetical protein